MEVTIRLICIKDDFYIAVPESEYKLLKILKSTTYKNNSVIKSEIDRMLVNKGKIMMPTDQWKSYLGHVFFTDADTTSHKELRERVTMGAFIHHQAKTGGRQSKREGSERGRETVNKSVVEDKDLTRDGAELANPEMGKDDAREKRIAVGADSKMYIANILAYLASLFISTNIYLNSQTGSVDENFGLLVSASEGLVAIGKSVVDMSSPLPDDLVYKTLQKVVSSLFFTPIEYVQGGFNAMYEWKEVGHRTNELYNLINGDNVPEKYIAIADDLAKFRGMPMDEILKFVNMDELPVVMSTEYKNDMNDSAFQIFSYFDTVQDFNEGMGEHSTGHGYGELLNGRSIHNLFSYANVWNDFRSENFVSRCANVFYNLIFSKSDLLGSENVANTQIRRQTIITLGILIIFTFAGLLQAASVVKKYRMDKTKAENLKELARKKNINYDDTLTKKPAEYVLDIFEMMQVTVLLFTAAIEFIGISNIVGSEKSMDTFVSQSYSTNWYYMSAIGTRLSQPYLRAVFGTEARNPDRFDMIEPAKVALDLVMASIIHDPTVMLQTLVGVDSGSNNALFARLTVGAVLTKRAWQLSKYTYKSYMGKHALTGAIIDMHANMLRDGKTSDAKILRDRLLHNDTFRRNIITQLCAI
jgi:hypothetical protein